MEGLAWLLKHSASLNSDALPASRNSILPLIAKSLNVRLACICYHACFWAYRDTLECISLLLLSLQKNLDCNFLR